MRITGDATGYAHVVGRMSCRIMGHRWDFGVDGPDLVWACGRCGREGGRRTYRDRSEARRYAAAFNRGRPKPPGPFLAAFGGLMPDRRRDEREEQRQRCTTSRVTA